MRWYANPKHHVKNYRSESEPAGTDEFLTNHQPIQRAMHRPASLQATDVRTLQGLIGNQAVLRLLDKSSPVHSRFAVQRELVIDNPDGTKPAIKLTNIKQFDQIRPGTRLFATELGQYVTYRGINRPEWSTIYLEVNGQINIYNVTNGKVNPYQPGQPERVKMTFSRVVNSEGLGGGDDYHCGALFEFAVQWAATGPHTGNGVMVTEVILPLEANGWFAQAGSRKQEKHVTADPGSHHLDMIGISAAKSKTQASATELPSASNVEGVSAAPDTNGSAVDFQYFEFVAADGTSRPIPYSGFLLSKRMNNGKLSIIRQPKAGQTDNQLPIMPGGGEESNSVIDINFGK